MDAYSNYSVLQMMLNEATKLLRQTFLDTWKHISKKDWTDDLNSAKYFQSGSGKELRDKLKKVQQTNLDSGNSTEWDITLIGTILSANPFKDILKKQKKTQGIHQLLSIRNIVSHSSVIVQNEKFLTLSEELVNVMVSLGANKEDVAKLRHHKEEFKKRDELDQHAEKLRESGNREFKNKNYKKAIELYTTSIVLPNLSNQEIGILYCNRSVAHLRLYEKSKDDREIDRAISDANHSISYYPVWYKGYFRLGEIYYAMNELEKAKDNYEKAIAFNTGSEEIHNLLANVRRKIGEQQRQQHLDQQYSPVTTEESEEKMLHILKDKRFNNTNVDGLQKMIDNAKTFAIKDDPTLQDVWKGHEYRDGSKDVKQNYEIAAKYYGKAVQKNNAEAMYNLALLTMRGHGVEQDYNTAIYFLKEAAKQKPTRSLAGIEVPNVGVAEAEHSLGLAHEQGTGVMKDKTIASYWYKLAVEHGSADAANNLGLMYLNGLGVKKDIKQAEKILILAHERGNPNASGNLVDLYIANIDPDRALVWHERSLEKSFYPKTRDEEIRNMIKNLKNFKHELNKNPKQKEIFESVEKHMTALKNSLDCGSSARLTELHDFNRDKLIDCADQGSITARKMVDAKDHFYKALYILEFEENFDTNEFIKTLYYAQTTEPLVCQIPYSLLQKMIDILKSEMNKSKNTKSEIDYQARVCYAILHMSDSKFVFNFLTASLAIYPNDAQMLVLRSCMYGFLQEFEKTLEDSKAALKIKPDDYDILYYVAVGLRLTDKNKSAIDFYEQFLSKAPIDHRKVPETYYAIAMCYLAQKSEAKMTEYYQKGLDSEKHQLFCFMPYDSNNKKMLHSLINISSISDIQETNSKREKQENHILNDYKRIEVINNHRKPIHDVKNKTQFLRNSYTVTSTYQPNKSQKMPRSIIGLKEVVFKDIDFSKDHIMDGYVLTVTNLETPIIGVFPSVHFVVEDKNQDVSKLCIYNLDEDYQSISDRFQIGCVFSIISPYIRLANDGHPMIRVDDPNSVLLSGTLKKNICRFCGKEDSKFSCIKCKARYCTKECQTNDWKLLNHKYVCSN